MLFYNTDDHCDLERIAELGGIGYQVLSHRDESGLSLDRIRNRVGSKLCCRVLEAPVVGMDAPVDVIFEEGGCALGDIEIIHTLGHADGSMCLFFYRSPNGTSYLRMQERVWRRSGDADLYDPIPDDHQPLARAIVVLVFWSYFEARIERLIQQTAEAEPGQAMDHLVDRHSFVGDRMDRFYRAVFSTPYQADLNALGWGSAAAVPKRVEQGRNGFAHERPEAIDDALIEGLVARLKDEHEGWIAVFNTRLREAVAHPVPWTQVCLTRRA